MIVEEIGLRSYRPIGDKVNNFGLMTTSGSYDYKLIEDAHLKATNSGARFFFTWNVNKLVLFDQKLWEKPLIERRVNEFDLGLDLHQPQDVERADVEALTFWLDWAFAKSKDALPKAA